MKKKILAAVLVFAMVLTVIAPLTVFADWEKQADGSWKYEESDGYYQNGFFEISEKYYCFDENGKMLTGWIPIDAFWYYADPSSGVVAQGWNKINQKWYYFDPEYFYMYDDGIWTIDGKNYCFAESGAMQTGWIKKTITYDYEGTYTRWFYAESSGELASGWKKIGSTWYYFAPFESWMYSDGYYEINGKNYYFYPSGALGVGWIKRTYTFEDGYSYSVWYYANGSGELQTRWQKIGGAWYYFNPSYFEMLSNTWDIIDGKPYFFDKSGKMGTGWCKRVYEYGDGYSDVTWYYANSDGVLQSSWQQIGGSWYYFSPYSYYMCTGVTTIGGETYVFDSNGRWTKQTGWLEIKNGSNTTWYYIESDGNPAKGWKKIGGVWYYFETYSGGMMKNGTRSIDGEWYAFASNGAWITGTGWQKFTYPNGSAQWIYTENGKIITGWKKLGGTWYYFNPPYGYMVSEDWLIDGKIEQFNSSGAWTGTRKTIGWVQYAMDWYYVDNTNGDLATGWRTINGVKYYFDPDWNYMYGQGWWSIDGKGYYFARSGALQTDGFIYTDWGERYYADADGVLQGGWLELDGVKYYFDPEYYYMYYDRYETIDDIDYYFDYDGGAHPA